MTPRFGHDETLKRLRAGEISAVLVGFADIAGQMIGKRCTASYFQTIQEKGMRVCDLMLAQDIEMIEVEGAPAAGAATGYSDLVFHPVMETLRASPVTPDTAIVIADCLEADQASSSMAPRSILSRQVERLAARGLSARFASELEFYVFDGDFDDVRHTGAPPQAPLTHYDADGHITQLARRDAMWAAVQSGLEDVGIGLNYIKFEGGAGQAEIVLHHDDVLTMADKHILYKELLRQIIGAYGCSVSFMAMPFDDQAGSSGHIHYSLCEPSNSAPVMASADEIGGLSKDAGAFLAGQLSLTPDIMACLAPTVNAYKRFALEQLAPRTANWGVDDRTAAFRIVVEGDARHIECRLPGADINPYLAFASLIAAGIDGLERGLTLEKKSGGALPSNLRDAARAFSGSKVMADAFDEPVRDHIARYAFHEADCFDAAVTDWERRRYMERI